MTDSNTSFTGVSTVSLEAVRDSMLASSVTATAEWQLMLGSASQTAQGPEVAILYGGDGGGDGGWAVRR